MYPGTFRYKLMFFAKQHCFTRSPRWLADLHNPSATSTKKKKKKKEQPFDGSFSHCTACSRLNFLLVESLPAAKEAYDG